MDTVLLSGGIDSLVCAEQSRRIGTLRGAVFVDYGHPAQIPEGWKVFAYCGEKGVPLRVVHAFGLDLGDMATESGARIVPHRNAVLLALAANVCSAGDRLIIGANAEDREHYRDCRPRFIRAMSSALGVDIAAPLIDFDKPTIIRAAKALGLKKGSSWSCYGSGPLECGQCPSCESALEAWDAPSR